MELFDKHRARQNIVVVYHSAEKFLQEFRAEHRELHGEWQGDRVGSDPFNLALVNLARLHSGWSPEPTLRMLFDYYRLVRNWVVHPKAEMPELPRQGEGDSDYKPSRLLELFGPVAAPNPPDHLTFDDFILFSRLVKHLAEDFCVAAKPSPDLLREIYARRGTLKRFKKFVSEKRRWYATVAQLRTDFGLDYSTANWIANELATVD